MNDHFNLYVYFNLADCLWLGYCVIPRRCVPWRRLLASCRKSDRAWHGGNASAVGWRGGFLVSSLWLLNSYSAFRSRGGCRARVGAVSVEPPLVKTDMRLPGWSSARQGMQCSSCMHLSIRISIIFIIIRSSAVRAHVSVTACRSTRVRACNRWSTDPVYGHVTTGERPNTP